MPSPKFVVAVGSCGITGGAFQGCYNIVGSIADVIPVHAFVPGCPPRPEAIIYGVVALLNTLKQPVASAPEATAAPKPENEATPAKAGVEA